VQVRAGQIEVNRLSLVIAMGAAIVALLALAVPVRAEAPADATIAPDPVAEVPVEAPVSPEPSPEPAPAPISVPEPVEAPEVVSATDSVGEVGSDSAPSLPDPTAVSAPVAEIDPPVHVATEPDPTASLPVHRVSKLVEGVAEGSSKPVVSAVERVTQTAQAPVQQILEVVEPPARKATDLFASQLPPTVETTATGPGDEVSPAPVPSPGRPLSTGASLQSYPSGGLESLLAKYTDAVGGGEPSSPGVAESPKGAKGAPPPAIVPDIRSSDAFQSPNGPTPLEAPVPLPRSPGVAASGSGAAFFVPFAALLALLALVAPAIPRRFREVPDFPAPTPFICALERPG
jgi:hypothetical protein